MFCDSEFCAIAIARQQARPVFAGLYRVAIGRTENSQAADGDPRAPRRIPRFAWAHDWVSDSTLAAVFQTLLGASSSSTARRPRRIPRSPPPTRSCASPNGVSLSGKFDVDERRMIKRR